MTDLLIKFNVSLDCFDTYESRHYGPLFHRWLPDGEKNAVLIKVKKPRAQIKIWFNRLGYPDNRFIKFDYRRAEVDTEIMEKQGVIEGGPLYGKIILLDMTEEEMEPIRQNKTGDARYEALGKQMIKKIFFPYISSFINNLRLYYGQYWLPPLKEWDSRRESLGRYCDLLNFKCSFDEGETWQPFLPTPIQTSPITVSIASDDDYRKFINEQDWNELEQLIGPNVPSLPAFMLSRAHQLLDEKKYKYSLIEGITCLEVTISEFLKNKVNNNKEVLELMKGFWNLSLKTQFSIVGTLSDSINNEDIEDMTYLIELRHKVMHEGYTPNKSIVIKLEKLLVMISEFIEGPGFRFPSINTGNMIQPIENWEKK